MKIRKALAVVLSLAMTVTLMPATAFASTAKVANVPTVKDGNVANSLVRVQLDESWVAGAANKQTVTIDVTQHGEFAKFDDEVTLLGYTSTETPSTTVPSSFLGAVTYIF